MVIKELVRIIDRYEQVVDDEIKEYLATTFFSVDAEPTGLPFAEDIVAKYEKGELNANQTYYCLARVRDLWSDPTYNRILQLRYSKNQDHIEKTRGFSHKAADSLSGFIRPSLKIITTKGNNRTTMRYACGRDGSLRVVIALKPHPKNISIEEMIRLESIDHNTDCNYRTSQGGDDKFKSAFYAKEGWAVKIHDFLVPFDIGVAGTLENAKYTCHSHRCVDTARTKGGEDATQRYLKAFTDVDVSDQVLGNALVAGSIFLKTFASQIDKIDQDNNCDSFTDMVRYQFVEREKNAREAKEKGYNVPLTKNVKQEDIVRGNGLYKGNEPAVCRLVSLYNDYCGNCTNYAVSGRNNTAIPVEDGKDFADYIGVCDPLIRNGLRDIAKSPVSTV